MTDDRDMVRRQKVLADFGDLALSSNDLDEVLQKACQLVGEALGTDLAKILQIEDNRQELLVRAGVGWPEGVVGKVRLPMNERSSETYAVIQAKPVCTANIEREHRFDFPAFMKEAGVVGIVNVPIFLPGKEPYGLLQVDSREEWNPDTETTEFLRTYTTILGPIIDRLHKVHALRQAADRNETLLHELQHRIKNNIGAIRSLVRLRENETSSDEARAELSLVGDRIEALRLVHEHVYAAHAEDRLPLRPYVTQLLDRLLDLHRERSVRLKTDIDDVEIHSDKAVPLGLILNEFTTNSLKYAFGETQGPLISIEVRRGAGHLSVSICDNGIGLRSGSREASSGSGTGMALIEGLSRQIGATPDWSSSEGTALHLEVPHR